jgi:hypothetical protein
MSLNRREFKFFWDTTKPVVEPKRTYVEAVIDLSASAIKPGYKGVTKAGPFWVSIDVHETEPHIAVAVLSYEEAKAAILADDNWNQPVEKEDQVIEELGPFFGRDRRRT